MVNNNSYTECNEYFKNLFSNEWNFTINLILGKNDVT